MAFPNSTFEDMLRDQSYLFDQGYNVESIMNESYFSQGTGIQTPIWSSIVKQQPPIENGYIVINVDDTDLAEESENAFNPVIGSGTGTDSILPVDEKVCFAQAVAINVGCSANAGADEVVADEVAADEVAADEVAVSADEVAVSADADEVVGADEVAVSADAVSADANDGWKISTGKKKNYRRHKNKTRGKMATKSVPPKKSIPQRQNHSRKNVRRSVSETATTFGRTKSYPTSSPFTINLKNIDARIASAVIGQCGRIQQDLMKRYNLKSLHIGDPVLSTSHKKLVNITIVGLSKHLVTSAARAVCTILSKEEDNYIELDFNTFKNYLNACRV